MILPYLKLAVLALGLASTAASQHVPVAGARTGVDSSSGATPERRNINDICNDAGPQRTLYFRALMAMQSADPNDPTSWFQIAGIHGRPFMEWNGEGRAQGGTGWGYCLHTEAGFLTWHRAYLALYEQTLVNHALQVAEEYPEDVRSQYQQAAQRLRAPYWDWAADPSVPPCAATPEVTLDMPDGSQSVSNPLFSYVFPQAARNGDFGQIPDNGLRQDATVRCPADQANADLAMDNLKDDAYGIFTRSNTYAKASAGTGSTVISFEQPHNTVHVDGACGNHFSSVGSAGFEPLFMLHHANVDRLWAIWQEIYPSEKTMSQSSTTGGSFSIASRSSFGPTTHLSPFYGPGDSQWNSLTVADVATFGYTYPGIQYWNKTQEQRKADATSMVNRMYGPSGSQTKPRSVRRRGVTKRESETRYFAKIELDVDKVPLPISMRFFLGGKFAGTFAILHAPDGSVAKGEVALHRAVEKNEWRDQYGKDELCDKIEENMQVTFVQPDGTEISPETLDGAYKVELEDAEMTPNQSSDELPTYDGGRKRPIKPRPWHGMQHKSDVSNSCPARRA